jgi:hypothetical protein
MFADKATLRAEAASTSGGMEGDGVRDITLEAAAPKWLRYERRCLLACLGRNPLPEMCIPDILDLTPDRRLIEIEIKRTMADFRQNGDKRSSSMGPTAPSASFHGPTSIERHWKALAPTRTRDRRGHRASTSEGDGLIRPAEG